MRSDLFPPVPICCFYTRDSHNIWGFMTIFLPHPDLVVTFWIDSHTEPSGSPPLRLSSIVRYHTTELIL